MQNICSCDSAGELRLGGGQVAAITFHYFIDSFRSVPSPQLYPSALDKAPLPTTLWLSLHSNIEDPEREKAMRPTNNPLQHVSGNSLLTPTFANTYIRFPLRPSPARSLHIRK
uniref:Uncharacterized protein n=1 Tax=Macrostomum lignano TaxID=282301 RepID=A0A1I8IB44_9PLAT